MEKEIIQKKKMRCMVLTYSLRRQMYGNEQAGCSSPTMTSPLQLKLLCLQYPADDRSEY